METFVKIIATLGATLLVVLLLTYPMMLLWNWLCPVLFGLPIVTFWQTLGLGILCQFIFKGSTK